MQEPKKETERKTEIQVLDKGFELTQGNAEAACCNRTIAKLTLTND